MKVIYCFLFVMVLSGCGGGGLSEEKREALKEEMKAREIKRVPEEDIVTEALKQGRELYKAYNSNTDSLVKAMEAKIYFLDTQDPIADLKESELMEAYKYSANNNIANLTDNVQREGEEMIYSVPLIKDQVFKGIYIIRIPRKQIVLGL